MNTLLKGTTRRPSKPSIVMLPLVMVLLSNSEVHSFQSHSIKAPWHQSTSHPRKGISLDHQRPRINRGTSTSTTVMSGLGDAWTTYMSYLDSAPVITKCITAGIIMPLGDLSAQILETSKAKKAARSDSTTDASPSVDWARVFRFFIFGASLQPLWNHFYFQALDNALPPPPEWYDPVNLLKVGIDQGLQAPIFTAIIFAFLGTLEGKSFNEIKQQLNQDFAPTMLANWKVWIPATFINLCFLDPELRVGFVNVVFFGWSIFLSLIINKKEEMEGSSPSSSSSSSR